MTRARLIDIKVDIYLHPDSVSQPNRYHVTPIAGEVKTIGDLHGNAIKLLFFLTCERIFSIGEADYSQLVKIYQKSVEKLTQQDLTEFENIINGISITDRNTLIRLLGDILADRGKNDYFTLLILKKLSSEQIPFEVIFSNHDAEFLAAYKKDLLNGLSAFISTRLGDKQDSSLQSLAYLLNKKLIDPSVVRDMVQKHYANHVKLLSYSIDYAGELPEITLFTHAPVNFGIIERLFKKFELIKPQEFLQFNSVEEVAQSIEKVNRIFREQLLLREIALLPEAIPPDNEIVSFAYGLDKRNKSSLIPQAIYELAWGREEWHPEGLTRLYIYSINEKPIFCIRYAHAHDTPEKMLKEKVVAVINLNNKLGKVSEGKERNIGHYTIAVTRPALKVKEKKQRKDKTEFAGETLFSGSKRSSDDAELKIEDERQKKRPRKNL